MRIFNAVQTEPKTLLIFKKGRHRGIEDLLKCAPMFLFFILMKLKAFCVTQNDTPKIVKMSAFTNTVHRYS